MSILAVDFGGTRIKAGIVCDGEVLDTFTLDVPSNPRLEDQLPLLKKAFLGRPNQLIREVVALACALPCIVQADHLQVTRTFGKYDDSKDFPLKSWVEEELGLPVIVEHDARAAAMGEWHSGAGREFQNLVMITLGTGIGTAVIVEGKLLYGAHGVAGALGGHLLLYPDGLPCTCGMQGCIEAYASTWALPSLARESSMFAKSSLANKEPIDYRLVFEHARLGDALAVHLRDQTLLHWGILLVNHVQQYDPECIVLGGGIMAAKDEILPYLTRFLQKHLDGMHRDIQLLPASLGDHAALVGLDHLWQRVR